MNAFSKILIANRGEIAVRIIKTLRKLGISSVAICSENEVNALHARMADEVVWLKGDNLSSTYLDIEQIIEIAIETHSEAIHPGYGFLSENAEFARKILEAGLQFIGPSPDSIEIMGNKQNARQLVRQLSIPLIDGVEGDIEEIKRQAAKLKFPVLVKALAGGGGKAMRIVRNSSELDTAVEFASREAMNYFGDDRVYIEHYFEKARHIEIQVLADNHGNILIPGERECTVQRRYQKVIEESPSIFLKEETRKKMMDSSRKIVREINYVNAGTIEFLVDEDQNFYFLEMNTRIQVEHAVTELVSGIDIVEMQVNIAAGIEFKIVQEDLHPQGHAIEARLYAEDPALGFIPSPGFLVDYHEPLQEKGLRIDSGIDGPCELQADYDPLIAKIIVHGKDRNMALKKLSSGLSSFIINGVQTNREFLIAILKDTEFLKNKISTSWLEQRLGHILESIRNGKTHTSLSVIFSAWILGYLFNRNLESGKSENNIWRQIGYWRILMKKSCIIDGRQYDFFMKSESDKNFVLTFEKEQIHLKFVSLIENHLIFLADGRLINALISIGKGNEDIVFIEGLEFPLKCGEFLSETPALNKVTDEDNNENLIIKSPMHGRIVKLNAVISAKIRKGDVLYILDAMKIETRVLAPMDGYVKDLLVMEGEQVGKNQTIMIFENKYI